MQDILRLLLECLLLCVINLLGNESITRSNILAKTVLIFSSVNGDSSAVNGKNYNTLIKMTVLDNRSWGSNNALTVMLAAFLTANGGAIKWQG